MGLNDEGIAILLILFTIIFRDHSQSSSDFKTSEHSYKFGEWWEMEYGRGMGTMHIYCSREATNIILCR